MVDVGKVREFLELYYKNEILDALKEEKKSIVISYKDLENFDYNLAQELLNRPEEVLNIFSEVASDLMQKYSLEETKRKIKVRVKDLPKTIRIRDIRSEHVGKLIQVEGIIKLASEVRPQVIAIKYRHDDSMCLAEFWYPQKGFKIEKPKICPVCKKSSSKFTELERKYVDTQRLLIEEPPDVLERGEQPGSISVFLREDLCEPKMERRTLPGTRIKVVGIVKEIQLGSKQSTLYDLCIEAVYVEPVEKELEEIEITPEDEKKIKEIARSPNFWEIMLKSFAPSIHGYEEIKKAILLQLVGGVKKVKPDGTKVRGDIHILLVGDPGVAKTQLLRYVAEIAPKGKYVSGKGATAVGLTASLVRDEFLKGGWALQAGVLVLASGGICCIDELEKIKKEELAALHEALESQSYHYETEILLLNGYKIKIGELVDTLIEKNKNKVIKGKDCEILNVSNLYILSYDFSKNEFVPVKVTRVSRHKKPKYYIKLKFSNGREIIVTPEHPVYVWRDGKFIEIPAENVCEGEFTLGPAKLNLPVIYHIDEKIAELLGYILSEGFTYKNENICLYEIGFTNTSLSLSEKVGELLYTTSGKKPLISVRIRENEKPLYTLKICSKEFYEYLKKEFPEIFSKARNKRIPVKILFSDENAKKAFIRAFFEGDGYYDSSGFGICTSSRKLAEDFQDLLLSLGIYSVIQEENRNGTKYYKVRISGLESMLKFYEIVKDTEKGKDLIKYIEKAKRKMNNRDIIPIDLVKKIKEIVSKLHIDDGQLINYLNRHNLHRKLAIKYLEIAKIVCKKAISCNERCMRKVYPVKEFAKEKGLPYSAIMYHFRKKDKIYQEYIEKVKIKANEILNEIESLLKMLYNIRFIKIVKKEVVYDDRYEWVYDVTVEPYKNFVSHCLVLHNTVTISKATIHATLKAECAVLAAANPKFGRWDRMKTIAEQIDLPPTILNRFDLIFVILDVPEEKRDEAIAEAILKPLVKPEEVEPLIPPELLRKYIAYAKKIIPQWTEEAINKIKEFYVKLRKVYSQAEGIKTVPISPRQLESLIRLAEASARLRLSKFVTREDAELAISLLTYSLKQVGIDPETGKIDIDIIYAGVSASQRSKYSLILDIIEEMQKVYRGPVPVEDVLEEAERRKIPRDKAEEIIKKLLKDGIVYEPKPGFIQKV